MIRHLGTSWQVLAQVSHSDEAFLPPVGPRNRFLELLKWPCISLFRSPYHFAFLLLTSAMADADSSHKSAHKPYVRVITDKRREQNRTSQKKYRERLRKRLEELEEKAASTKPAAESDVIDSQTSYPSQRRPSGIVVGDIEAQRPLTQAAPQTFDFGDVFQAAGDIALPQGFASTLPSFQASIFTNDTPSPAPPSLDADFHSLSSARDVAVSPVTAADLIPMPDPDSIDLRHFWPVPITTNTAPYTPPSPPRFNIRSPLLVSSLHTSPPFPIIYENVSATSSSTSSSHLPDPYINYLQLAGEACFNATFAIAASLGISRSAYMNDHPSLFFHSTSANFYHLPRSLRPTPAQLTLPHPVYLDCIIFPAFRSRAIILSARGELDHPSLFVDLMHGGLVCWGNANATSQNGRGMRDGVAWSKRSWEAKCWFLKRWPVLVGTEDDDPDAIRDEDGMWEGCRWWATLRGEDGWIDL
jgi:Domain of unknown function (DUF3425)